LQNLTLIMFSFKKFFVFITFFLVFGMVGAIADLLTGGSYGIRVAMVEGGKMASVRTRNWIAQIKRGWIFSPVLALSFLISPVIFVFMFLLYLFDTYRAYQVFYDDDGKRVVYPTRALRDDDIVDQDGAGFLAGLFRGTGTGILYQGRPIPDNFKEKARQTAAVMSKAKDLGWGVTKIGGVEFLTPPQDAPDQRIEDFELED